MTDTLRAAPPRARPARATALRARALDRSSPLRRLDAPLGAAVAALLVLGSLLVWSATRQTLRAEGLPPESFLHKHVLNILIGLALATGATLIAPRTLQAWVPVVYGLSCLGLVAVLSPLGATVNGAHSWILLPAGFQVQPSEFAKVAVVVGLAGLLGRRRDGAARPRDRDVVAGLVLAAVPMGLIMLQPDLGTTLVLIAVVLGLLAVAVVPSRWLVGLALAGVVVCVGAVHVGVLSQYQVDRFAAFTDPQLDPRGAGYNTRQARIAIGSGGVTGTGLFRGSQTEGRFIPEQQTDFVFTVAGEELGLLGGGAVIVLLGVVLWRGLRIASRAPDAEGRLVATGVVCWFGFQGFVNIGMTLGIMPVTGLPLPFVSYGGSAMFANLAAVGLLQNIAIRTGTRPLGA